MDTNEPVILAYVKRQEDANTLLFADDERRHELSVLFNDPFVEITKLPFEGDMIPLDDGSCYEIVLSANSIEAMERQYITSNSQLSSLSAYEPTGEEGSSDIRVIYQFDGNKLIFKRTPKTQQLHDSKIISLDGEPTITAHTNVLAIDERVDAVYHIASKRFYFTSFQAAKHVFGTIEVYYRSATQNDVDEWLDVNLFDIDSQFDTFAISTPNRKKMELASDELKINLADVETREKILAYAHQHAPKMLIINNKFNIKKNADITEALRLITGAYYHNDITGDLMIANTPKKVS